MLQSSRRGKRDLREDETSCSETVVASLQSSGGWPRQALQCTHMTAMAMGAQSQRRSAAEHSSGDSTMWWGSNHPSLCMSIVLRMRRITVCDILCCPELYMLPSVCTWGHLRGLF